MSLTPQIVHVCNHVIEIYEKKAGTLAVTRNNLSGTDEILSGISVQQIYSVYKVVDEATLDYHFYYKNADYNIIGTKYIQWIGENKPSAEEVYNVECYYVQPSITEYAAEDCPRCLGNGWYVSLMPQSETTVSKLMGLNKIVQDFIKIIFTYQVDGDTYGTRLFDYVGKIIMDPNQICSEIASIIYGAAEKYKELQMSSILDGNQLADDEILDRIMINFIEFDEETGGIYSEVSLYSAAGEESQIGVGV